MPSPYKEIPITFEKGLVTEIEESLLDVGQASELLNWEPAANGALRTRNAFESMSKLGLPSEYNVRGFGSVAVGGSAAAAAGPSIVQTSVWPNGDQDPVTTKTLSLSGCNFGNVLVAVATDDSGETPTIPIGWTQRAISTAERQYVKFYTKLVTGSAESFTYTITTSRLRSLTLYEVANLDAEDPGIKWAAATVNTGSGGTDTISVTGTDTDGGLAIIGTLYDGGTPNTAIGGTAGMTSVSQDNANTRTGVSFDDLDQLDGTSVEANYTTPSWTPPDSGLLIAVLTGYETSALVTPTISGNNLTWTQRVHVQDTTTAERFVTVWTADLSQSGKTTGSITVTPQGSDVFNEAGGEGYSVSFVRAIGANLAAPIPQSSATINGGYSLPVTDKGSTSLANPLGNGSAVMGIASAHNSSGTTPNITHDTGAGQWTDAFDKMSWGTTVTTQSMLAYQAAGAADVNGGTFDCTGGPGEIYFFLFEVAGSGTASRDVHGTFLSSGTVTDQMTYVANRRMTHKMVVWGFTPQSVSANPDQISFNIVMALSTGPTTYQVYLIDRDEITTGTWTLLDTVTDASSSTPWVSFAQGAGRLAWSATSMLAPRTIQLNPVIPGNILDLTGLAGRALTYHKDRLFVAGSESAPSRVYFSDIGLPTSFTTSVDFLDIGGDDGEAIQGSVSVEGLLLFAKTNRAYLVSGSGVESFFVNELSGGTAAAGQPVVRTPYGTILAGNDDIWVIQGGGVDPMSRPLGAGYEITGNVSVGYAQDSAIICDADSGQVWRVNLVTGAWSKESIEGENQYFMAYSLNGRYYYGTDGSTTAVGGTRRLDSARNFDDTSDGIPLVAATGKLALLGPSVKYTPRYLYMQLRSQDPSHDGTLYVEVSSDLGTEQHAVTITEEIQRESLTLGRFKGAEWLKIRMHTDGSAIRSAIDMERMVLGVNTEAPRTHD